MVLASSEFMHTIEASDLARTETRAFLIVASVADCSATLEELSIFWTLLGPQPCDSESGLSSLPVLPLLFLIWSLFPASIRLFWGVFDLVLSSDEELDTLSSTSAVPLVPISRNCLGTIPPPTPWFFSSAFALTTWIQLLLIDETQISYTNYFFN